MYRPARRPLGVAGVAVAAALLLAGCDSGSGGNEEKTSASTSAAPTAEPETLEALGKAVGCEGAPKEAGKTLDFRQGVCKSADGAQYVLLTFDTDDGQRGWLDTAQLYGGVYLVGKRWVLSADPRSAMEAARAELGGTIEDPDAKTN
ncbi:MULTISPECIES: hypothetical protein [Streptomyces]|uniref:DUF3558 domain-containing protein n=2 Tax=Streptomyces TaxID=1883 RepID=A0ABV9IR40_9ACTN